MVLNTHCHVFNLQSVFTSETKDILINRLHAEGFPERFAQLVAELLEYFVKHGGGLNPNVSPLEQVKDLLGVIEKSPIKDRLPSATVDSIQKFLDALERQTDPQALQAVSLLFDWLDMRLSYEPLDMLAFLAIAFAKSIDAVTDALFKQISQADIVFPLMMDITRGTGDDNAQFESQAWNTKRQCLRYPGRILPFYAFNPARPDAVEKLTTQINEGAFVGVKLYPSLGYEISEVQDICQFCSETETPITMHCSHGGFYKDEVCREYCDPRNWRDLFFSNSGNDLANLKVSFAHFGGIDDLVASLNEKDTNSSNWAATIIGMIKGMDGMQQPCDRVFADLSHHNGVHKVKDYFKALRTLLADEQVGKQVLWGTDYFLLQRHVSDRNYASYFSQHLAKKGNWTKISQTNPLRFIGLDFNNSQGVPGKNIQRHIQFLQANITELRLKQAAQWVKPHLT